jgi:hypothetical protein
MSGSQVLGAVAGVVVGYFFGPQAGFATYAAVSGVGAYLSQPDNVGPKLEDLRVQMSSYGANIPFEWGVNRHAGTIMWPKILDAVEHQHEESSKGGPSNITFTYTLSCAVLVCEGPIAGIRRIWANKKIVYDISASNTGATQDPKIGAVRFYLGTEDQEVDPLIEATDGASPAYLGYAYVVFEDYDVTELNGRPPQWEFEVVESGAGNYNEFIATQQVLPATGGWRDIAWNGSLYVATCYGSSLVGTSPDGVTWTQRTFSNNLNFGITAGGAIFCIVCYNSGTAATSTDGIIWTTHALPVGASAWHDVAWNGTVFCATAAGASCATSPEGATWTAQTMPADANWLKIVWNGSVFCAIALDSQVAVSVNGVDWALGVVAPIDAMWRDIAWNGTVFCAVGDDGAAATSPDGLTWTERTMPPGANWAAIAWNGDIFCALANESTIAATSPDGVTWTQRVMPTNSKWISITSDGSTFVGIASESSIAVTITFDDTLSPAQVPLSTIVSDICLRAGLTADDIDVTQLTDLVDGYIVPRQMTARAAIEPLQAAFYVDAVESDDKIKFVKRGASSAVTIPQAERAAHEFGQTMPDALSIVRAFELELPYQCDVEYPDVDADHLVGNQYDRRITKDSKQKINLQLPIVMTAVKAKEIARVTLYQAWLNQSYRWTTTRKYAKYEPTDVVSLPTDAASYTAVITSKKEQPNGVIEWEGRMTAVDVYVQSGADAAPANYIPQSVFSPDVTTLVLLDIPLLRDEDDSAGFYVAMGGSAIRVPLVLLPLPIPTPPPDPAPGPTPTLYVAATGSDSNPGTLASPFLTIAHAASVAVPDDVISVASGTYTGNLTTSASGTAGHPVTYISAVKYGAKIIGTGTGIHWTDNGDYTDISGFDVSGSGRLGIYTTGDHVTVHHCYVHDIMLTGGVTGDGGAGIQMFGAFSTAHHNKVVRIAAGVSSVTVQGIYLLGASANAYDNIVGDISAYGIHQWHGGTTSTFDSNTVFNCGGGGILIGAGDSGMLAGGSQHNFITNNIVANCPGYGVREYSYTGTGTSYNTYRNNITYNNAGGNVMTATGDVIADLFTANPLFVNYQADGTGDYHLQAISPAIGAGNATYSPATDFDDIARPQGGTPDIGALEYVA